MIPPLAVPTALPDDTGPQDDPMTGDQADLLRALCEDAGEPFNAGLSQAEALARIEDLTRHLNTDLNL
ncbi:Protein of unknown function [Loktanella fryxellensis]|uniref:DUF3072 domain-containing protein n=1 Tax=Loktanella fryxellensis TaxID=245187 RepID=A0A1H7YRX8_9RHOB|nr:DUF3072 domain-containing protein [Loktanella fryxellensis]SEM49002.1 Protein of unknown function [Loktanella fryxellensis]